MPLKALKLDSLGTLFFCDVETGEKIFEINNVDLEVDAECIDYSREFNIGKFKETITFTVDNDINWNSNNIKYILGLPVPNNWLKMHGKVMRRRKTS